MKFIKYLTVIVACMTLLASCGEEFMEAESTAYLDSEKAAEIAASDPEALDAYLLGAFSWLVQYNTLGLPNDESRHDDFSFMCVLHSTDMMGEDIAINSAHWFNYDYENDNREFNYVRTRIDWTTFYTVVAKANEIISFFPEEPANIESKGVMAHGYALRGFAYYYLIQLYQHPVKADGTPNYDAPGIPLLYSNVEGLSAEDIAARKGRNTVRMVYEQIESDLTKAVKLFEAGYERPSKNYMDASVANGLLARYYLLSQQWENAAAAAKKAYTGYTLNTIDLQPNISTRFTDISNTEWMWGFDHNTETQTSYASFFSHISNYAPGYCGLAYSSRLIDKRLYESIPNNDLRKNWFNGPEGNEGATLAGLKIPYANLKFGYLDGWVMDYMYMRAPEMYLIEAEALAHQNKKGEAATALKPLMQTRIPGWDESTLSVNEVWQQRRIELWGEGFSYFDLKRLDKGIDRTYEGNNHLAGYQMEILPRDKRWIYQIPRQEMQENKAITEAEQND